jgi:hypothetical protein
MPTTGATTTVNQAKSLMVAIHHLESPKHDNGGRHTTDTAATA